MSTTLRLMTCALSLIILSCESKIDCRHESDCVSISPAAKCIEGVCLEDAGGGGVNLMKKINGVFDVMHDILLYYKNPMPITKMAIWGFLEYGHNLYILINEYLKSSDWSCDEPKVLESDVNECFNNYYSRNYRTLSGKCNNLESPLEGSAGTHFNRIGRNSQQYLPDAATIAAELYEPNPYDVAAELLHTQPDGESDVKKSGQEAIKQLNFLGGAWIHFIVHDLAGHDQHSIYDEPHEIRSDSLTETMYIPRLKKSDESLPDCPYTQYKNIKTAYFDASQIYGMNEQVQNKIMNETDKRKFKLSYSSQYNEYQIPWDSDNSAYIVAEEPGFWTGLNIFYLLFTQEHNYIIDELDKIYPELDAEEQFHIARLIIAATMAKTHVNEFIPALVGETVIENKFFSGYFEENFLFNNSENYPFQFESWLKVTDLLSQKMEKHIPFQKTEMWDTLYNFHSVLKEDLYVGKYDNNDDDNKTEETVKLSETFWMSGAKKLNDKYSMKDIIYSFCSLNKLTKVGLYSYPPSITSFKGPDGNVIYDLATVDLLRMREKGLPKYTKMRKILGLEEITSYTQLTDDEELIGTLESFYDTIDDMDLLIGMRLENTGGKRKNYVVSETQLWAVIHSDLFKLNNDRFYNQNFNVDTYTKFGMNYLATTSLKDIIIRHYPELKDQMTKRNMFFPWDQNTFDIDIDLVVADFEHDIFAYIKEKEELRYWLYKLFDIQIDSIDNVDQLLDELSLNKLKGKVAHLAAHYLNKIRLIIAFLSDFYQTYANKSPATRDYTLMQKLKYTIQQLKNIVSDEENKQAQQSSVFSFGNNYPVIIGLTAYNVLVTVALIFMLYFCQKYRNKSGYSKVQSVYSSADLSEDTNVNI